MRSPLSPAPSSPFRLSAPWVLLLALVLPASAFAATVWEISIVGDMDNEGRAVTRPSADKPAYYFPVVGGYQELGTKDRGVKPPPARDIVHELAASLAHEGYLVSQEVEVPAPAGSATPKVKALSPPPSLVLVFHWGYINPEKLDSGDDVMAATSTPDVLNRDKILGLTAGKHLDSIVDFGSLQTQAIMDGVVDDRFFVMISAYDFKAYNEQHKKVRLWVAKMSVPSAGSTMAEVLPVLIKSGAPLFGRETIGPKSVDVPIVPAGRVDVGTPTVVPVPPVKN